MEFSEDRPVIGIISRLADQKGFDLIFDIIEDVIRLDVQIVMLVAGERDYEKKGRKHSKRNIQNEFTHSSAMIMN